MSAKMQQPLELVSGKLIACSFKQPPSTIERQQRDNMVTSGEGCTLGGQGVWVLLTHGRARADSIDGTAGAADRIEGGR